VTTRTAAPDDGAPAAAARERPVPSLEQAETAIATTTIQATARTLMGATAVPRGSRR
jgi:hypothetical protein